MDWKQAIRRNREALAVVIAGLIAMVSSRLDRRSKSTIRRIVDRPAHAATLQGSGDPAAEITLPRWVRRSIYRILRPAESALRRLIVIVAAVRTTTTRRAGGAAETGSPLPDFSTFGQNRARPAFRLADPRKRFGEFRQQSGMHLGIPRISVPGLTEPAATKAAGGDDAVSATAILRRIAALDHALKTLPRQARRLNRLMARRAKAEAGPGRTGPIRPGHPPGFRKRPIEPVDEILLDCHCFALDCGFKPP